MWELPPRGWYKLNFERSNRDNKIGARFIPQSDVMALVATDSFPFAIIIVPETKIRHL